MEGCTPSMASQCTLKKVSAAHLDNKLIVTIHGIGLELGLGFAVNSRICQKSPPSFPQNDRTHYFGRGSFMIFSKRTSESSTKKRSVAPLARTNVIGSDDEYPYRLCMDPDFEILLHDQRSIK